MKYQFIIILTTICSFICNHACSEELNSKNQTNLYPVSLSRLEEGQKAIIVEMRTRFEAVDHRFEAVDKRFEDLIRAISQRFELVDQRFEDLARTISQRFELVDKRFDSLIREISQRFESIDKRFELMDQRFERMENQFDTRIASIEKQISNLGAYILAIFAAIIALIGYVIWDRKTAFEKAFSETFQKIENLFQTHVDTDQTLEQPLVHKNDASSSVLQEPVKVSGNPKNENFPIPEHIQEKFREISSFMNQFQEMRPAAMHAS